MATYELRGPSTPFKVDDHGTVSPLQTPSLKQALLNIGATVIDCTINVSHVPETIPNSGKSSRLSIV